MSDQNEAAARGDDDVDSAEGEELQFDQAEYATTPAGPICGGCNQPIIDDYYEINGKIICPTCRHQIEASFRGGSRLVRVLKAFSLGTVGAIAGAVLYYTIVRVTNWNIGLVSVLVGFMVGGAVRRGSGNRGGRFYQFLALFLTYSAIAAMLAPFAVEAFIKQAQQKGQAGGGAADAAAKAPANNAQARGNAKAPANAKALADAKAQPPTAKAQPHQAKQDPAEKAVAAPKEELKTEELGDGAPAPGKPNFLAFLGALLFLLVVAVGFFYALPVLVSSGDLVSGLIYCFALWEAWRINKAARLVFTGPFRVNPEGPATVKPEVVDDDE